MPSEQPTMYEIVGNIHKVHELPSNARARLCRDGKKIGTFFNEK